MKIHVQEISITSKPDCSFYLKIQWDKDLGTGFVILLCDGVSAWTGEVSEEEVSQEAQEMEISLERYVNDLRLMLTGEEQVNQSYSFHLTPKQTGSPVLLLSYEKVQRNMSFRYGMVELLPVPDPTKVIKDLISSGLKHSADLQAKKSQMEKENQGLRTKVDNMTAEMKRYIKEKEALERELYHRFLLILNEKKKKICTLQEELKELQKSTQDGEQRRKKGDEVVDENPENDDYLNTTDEEEDKEPEIPNQEPGTSVLMNNPMENRENDMADVAPSRKRRLRGIQPSESLRKRPPTEQRPSIRNYLIGRSKEEEKPTHSSPDPDQLFEDIRDKTFDLTLLE